MKFNFKILSQNDTTAFVNMTIMDSTQTSGTDTYLFLVKDNIWKISAFRALAKTTLLQNMLKQFSNISETEIDSIIETEKTAIHPNVTNRQEFNILLQNIKLTLELDDNIIKHFLNNKSQFDSLRVKAQYYIKNLITDNSKLEMSLKELEPEYKPLLITSIFYENETIKFNIGGVSDNNVGFIFVANKSKLPLMSPNLYILIREIGDGWYLYKTT